VRPRGSLILVLAANAISLLGNVMAAVAIPWFVLVETGSALQTGIAAVFASAPLAIGALFGGAITDRVGPRLASIVGDLLSAASVAGIPLLHTLGVLEFWHLLVLAFLGSLFDAPAASAREALLPDLTRAARLRTEQVTSALTATEHAAYLVGAPLAGLLIALMGAPALLWVDAASFAISAVLVGLARIMPGDRPTELPATNYRRELVEGLRWIWSDPAIRTVTLAATAGAFLIDPLSPVLLPIYVSTRFGDPAALGLTLGAYGVGGLVGIGCFSWLSRRLSRGTSYRLLWSAYAIASFGLVVLPELAALLAILVIVGVTVGAIDPLERAVRQERTPPPLRGRVFAAMYAVPKMVVPLGVLAAGLLVEVFGLRTALLAFAIGNALIAGVLVALPAAKLPDAAPQAAAPSC
jgi:MFS family permease